MHFPRVPIKFFRRGKVLCAVVSIPTRRGPLKFGASYPADDIVREVQSFIASRPSVAGDFRVHSRMGEIVGAVGRKRLKRAIMRKVRSTVKGEDLSTAHNVGASFLSRVASGVKSVAKGGLKVTSIASSLPVAKQLLDKLPVSPKNIGDAVKYGKFAASVVTSAKKGDPKAKGAIRAVTAAARRGDPKATEAAAALVSVNATLDAKAGPKAKPGALQANGRRRVPGHFPHTNERIYRTSRYMEGVRS